MATHIPFPVESGGTSHIRAVTRELLRRGHEIVLCANAGDGLPEGEVEGMATYRFNWRYRDIGVSQVAHRWRHGLRVSRLAKDLGADLIYERESSMGSVSTHRPSWKYRPLAVTSRMLISGLKLVANGKP